MNIYEVDCADWLVRVKASSFDTAISRGLKIISKKKKINGVRKKTVTVTAKVIARNVARNAEIPDFEE